EDNAARARAVAAVANRARPGYHLASLIAALAREIPAKASITEVKCDKPSDREKGGGDPNVPRFEVQGEVDNAAHTALDVMRDLEARLAKDPDIASVKIEPKGGLEAPVVPFRLVVVPNMPSAAPESKEN